MGSSHALGSHVPACSGGEQSLQRKRVVPILLQNEDVARIRSETGILSLCKSKKSTIPYADNFKECQRSFGPEILY